MVVFLLLHLHLQVFFLCIDVLLLNLCYKARLSLGYHLRNVKINLRAGKDQLITINLGQIERNDSLSKI